MKTSKYIFFAFAAFFCVSCIEDESVGAVKPISDIVIDEGSLEKVYNIQKNESLVIEPIVTQTNETLPLSYAWELDQEIYSTEKVFSYKGTKLGTFDGRLIVSNEDGKAFFTFTLNVNSPYEYGITVLSKDAEGRTHIAFMQEPMKEGDKKEFYDENCIEKNNPDAVFASNPADIIHTTGTLLLACQGKDGDDKDTPTIYYLNEKTFVVEDYVKSKEYPDFKPTRLLTPQGSYNGISYPVLSADGKMYSLPTFSAVLQPSHKFTSEYAQVGFAIGNDTENEIIVWDKGKNDKGKVTNGLACLYNGYGPFYCGSKYLLERDSLSTDQYYTDRFSKLTGIRTLVYIHKTPEQIEKSRREFIAIVQANTAQMKAIFATFFWRDVDGTGRNYEILDNGGFTKAASKNYKGIDEKTPCIANATYETMLFANGRTVKRWFYNSKKMDDKEVEGYLLDGVGEKGPDVLLEVGSAEAKITSFDISEDHQKTYVAFYEPNQEGKNGSVWVFDTNTGDVLEQYDNICYQPVKVLYKKKSGKKR